MFIATSDPLLVKYLNYMELEDRNERKIIPYLNENIEEIIQYSINYSIIFLILNRYIQTNKSEHKKLKLNTKPIRKKKSNSS